MRVSIWAAQVKRRTVSSPCRGWSAGADLLYLWGCAGNPPEGNLMTRTADELLTEALDLSEQARAQLARSLIASLDEAEEEMDPAKIEDAWFAEVSRRAAAIDAGAVSTRPAAEVFHAAREELRAVRARRMTGA